MYRILVPVFEEIVEINKAAENELIYTSLKIANDEMGFEKLVKWLEANVEAYEK